MASHVGSKPLVARLQNSVRQGADLKVNLQLSQRSDGSEPAALQRDWGAREPGRPMANIVGPKSLMRARLQNSVGQGADSRE